MTIGIFGGSYNPIHVGHAILANHIAQSGMVDEVWLMVSPQNPLKGASNPAMDAHRLTMAKLVATESVGVRVSDFEFSLPRPSYTIDTLRALSMAYPEHQFKIIIGADNWHLFDRWKAGNEIVRDFGVIIYPRRGFDIDQTHIPQGVEYIADAPIVEVSSTIIRSNLEQGRGIAFLTPTTVAEYIKREGLYI